MSDFTRSKLVRGRKRHRCSLCGLRIRKGARHWQASGVYMGDFWDHRYHEVCLSKTSEWDTMDWECFTDESEFRRHDLGMKR